MKSKRKTSSANPLVRLWREFLFTRAFEFETDASPKTCAHAIKEQLAYTTDEWTGGLIQVVLISIETASAKANHDKYVFRIEAKREERHGSYGLIASAEGSIHYDSTINQTLIRGEVRFGSANYLLTMIPALMLSLLVLIASPDQKLLYVIFAGILLTLSFWQMFRDRNRILNELEDALLTAKDDVEETMDDIIDNLSTNADQSDQKVKLER
jgi:hypothetical protein